MCKHEHGAYVGASQIFHCADCEKFVYKERKKQIMDIEFKQKQKTFGALKTGDLFTFALTAGSPLVHMRTDDGYINLNCGSEPATKPEDDSRAIIKFEGKLIVWEA